MRKKYCQITCQNYCDKLNKCKTGRSDDDVLDNLYRKSMAEHSNYFTPNKFSKKR
jgi:hypothetical protein